MTKQKYIVKEVKLVPVFTGKIKYDVHIIYEDGHEDVIMEVPADKIESCLNVSMAIMANMLDILKDEDDYLDN